jgi:superfamily II DNA or RNA helicase
LKAKNEGKKLGLKHQAMIICGSVADAIEMASLAKKEFPDLHAEAYYDALNLPKRLKDELKELKEVWTKAEEEKFDVSIEKLSGKETMREFRRYEHTKKIVDQIIREETKSKPLQDKNGIKNQFEQQKLLTLVVVDSLKEGYDRKPVSVVAIPRKLGDTPSFVQAVGRGARWVNDSTYVKDKHQINDVIIPGELEKLFDKYFPEK